MSKPASARTKPPTTAEVDTHYRRQQIGIILDKMKWFNDSDRTIPDELVLELVQLVDDDTFR